MLQLYCFPSHTFRNSFLWHCDYVVQEPRKALQNCIHQSLATHKVRPVQFGTISLEKAITDAINAIDGCTNDLINDKDFWVQVINELINAPINAT